MILTDLLENYIEEHSEAEPLLLRELDRETNLKVLSPHMISGHYQGRLLSFLSCLINPKRILEIGTYTGYATLCLAEGLTDNGEIHTIDYDKELVSIQTKYFEKSDYTSQIIRHTGDAKEIIPKLAMNFDLVFIDADKVNYSHYFNLIIDKMNRGGIIISDNVLWKGKIVEEHAKDKNNTALRSYNQLLTHDPRVRTLILPIRDGLTLSIIK